MSNLDKCKELIESFTEEQLAGVVDILEMLHKKAVAVPDHELLVLPEGYSVVRRASEVLEGQGKTLATELDTLCCFIVCDKKVPWDEPDDLPNAATLAIMEDVIAGRNMSGPFHSMEDLLEDLNAKD